jgi:hypothetical protein
MDDNKEKYLHDTYYDPKSGYLSALKLYHKVKTKDITLAQTKFWLANQETNQIFSKQVKKFNAIIGDDYSYQLDLAFFPQYRKQNSGYNTLMFFINITSRYLFVIPMKGKQQKEVNMAFEQIYAKISKITNITSDDESSFKNVIKKHSEIKHWAVPSIEKTNRPTRTGIVERVIRTIKTMLFRYMKSHKTKTWYNIIPDIVDNYNNTLHTTIMITPNQFNKKHGDRIRIEANLRGVVAKQETFTFSVGDTVRVLKNKAVFEKGTERFTKGLYIIAELEKFSFILKNDKGNILAQRFKNWQLKKVSEVEKPPQIENIPQHSSKTIKKENKFIKNQNKSLDNVNMDTGLVDLKRLKPKNIDKNRKDPENMIGKYVKIKWNETDSYNAIVQKFIISRQVYVVKYDDNEVSEEKYEADGWTVISVHTNPKKEVKKAILKKEVKAKPNELLGKHVRIQWNDEEAYTGVVSTIKKGGWFTIKYDDGDVKNERYNSNTWTILSS